MLTETRDKLLDLLKDNDVLKIRVKSQLELLINQFNFITGHRSAEAPRTIFPEQTEFMGAPLNTPEQVKAEDLTPKELERKMFAEKVDRLEAAIKAGTLSNEAIIEANPNPSDKLVIRGVAKRAGLENYRDGEVNLQFLEDIREGFKSQEEFETKVKQEKAQIENKD